MSQQSRSTYVVAGPSEIVRALVGLKDVRCPSCGQRAQVKERPVVRYVDLPVYGIRCASPGRSTRRAAVIRESLGRFLDEVDEPTASENEAEGGR